MGAIEEIVGALRPAAIWQSCYENATCCPLHEAFCGVSKSYFEISWSAAHLYADYVQIPSSSFC
jgi:hypothetical protein